MNQSTRDKQRVGPFSAVRKQLLWQDVAVAVSVPAKLESASLRARLGALIIDYLLCLLGAVIAVRIGSLWAPYLSLSAIGLNVAGGIGVAFLLNHLVLEAFAGQTVGKMILAIRVVGADGRPPARNRVLGRCTLGYALSLVPLGLGLIWAFWDSDRQTWHDKLFSTYVVKVNGDEIEC